MAQPKFDVSYVDRVDVSETFVDTVEKIGFENGVWKFEFCVVRLSEQKGDVVSGKKYPACRLVLSAHAGIDLANKLKGMMELMEKQGMLKTIPAPSNVVPSSGGKPG